MKIIFVLLLGVFSGAPGALAGTADGRDDAQVAVHLLDYVGADYPEFVRDGVVLDAAEYEEQLEFTGRVVALLQGLPERPERARLLAGAEALSASVRARDPGERVAAASGELRRDVAGAYALALVPRRVPDLARARALYAESCAGCHGAEGRGDGPAGRGLEPAPSDFTDAARSTQRSPYGLYNTITLGVGGTGMAAWTQLSEDDRWSLAFFASQLALTPGELARGEAAWKTGRHAETFAGLGNVASLSSLEVAERFGADAADAQRWLRAHPEALAAPAASPLRLAASSLRESLAAHESGDAEAAQRLALRAYLDGFELVEAGLDGVDAGLRARIEREMMGYRAALSAGASADDAEGRVEAILALLAGAEEKLGAGGLGAAAVFTSSLLILLREGLEAILVLAAIVAFLVKSGRRDALPFVHAGWAAALVAGAATWAVSTWAIAISGASRELTEAVSALLAAAVLLYVGVWLHSKANASAWQGFVYDRVGSALGARTLFALAGVSFLAVYRELFEIVLFYQALRAQAGAGSATPLLAGVGAALLGLAAIGWAVFRYGLRLPLGRFFSLTSLALATLAVVFVGQGVAALQEAGAVGVDAFGFVRIPALGIFPTAQTLAAQAALVLVAAASFALAGRRAAHAPEPADAP